MTINNFLDAGILIEGKVKVYTYDSEDKKVILFETDNFLKYGDEISYEIAEREITAIIGCNGLEIEV